MTPDEQLDHQLMGKGKYSHLSASQAAERDPAYMIWAYLNWDPKPCSKLLYDDCCADVAEECRLRRVAKEQGE